MPRCSTRSWRRKRFGFARAWRRGAPRNEGRVRALKQLRIERSERRERIGQVEIRAQDAAPSGKLVFEATSVTHRFGASPVIADFSARIMRATASASSVRTAAARRR